MWQVWQASPGVVGRQFLSRSNERRFPEANYPDLGPEDIQETLDVGQAADDALMSSGRSRSCRLWGSPECIIHGTAPVGCGRATGISEGLPYVVAFRPGDRAEGGDGVTIVELR